MSNNYYFSPIPEVEELFAERAALILGETWQEGVKRQTTNGDDKHQEGTLTSGIWMMSWDLDVGKIAMNGRLSVTCGGVLENPAKNTPAYLEFHESGVVTKRVFHTGGHKNNPDPVTPAEESYYNDGNIKLRGFYIKGNGSNPNPDTPAFTAYYRTGVVMTISHEEHGKECPGSGGGPSSISFYHDGKIKGGRFMGRKLTDNETISMIDNAKKRTAQGLCGSNFVLAGKTDNQVQRHLRATISQ